MKKRVKQLLAGMLCLILCLGQAPKAAYATESDEGVSGITVKEDAEKDTVNGEISSGTLGEKLTWSLNTDGILTISGEGKMPSYTSTSSIPWYDYRDSVTKIVIQEGVTSIGDYVFCGCHAIEVSISDSVTTIGDLAFNSCGKLQTLVIPKYVNSIAARAFDGCSSLTAIDVVDGNTSYCSIDGVLFSADKTQLIHYPDNYPENTYRIPDSVNSIGQGVFAECSTLEYLKIPASVTSFAYSALSDCNKLVSAGPIGSGCNIEYGWDKSIPSKAFYSSLLTSVTIGDDILSIGSEAFKWCNKLNDVYYGKDETAWNQISIDYGNEKLSNATLHLGDGTDITPEPPKPTESMPDPEPLGTPSEITEQGNGTKYSPYRIVSETEFARIAQQPDAYYVLAADITISENSNIEFSGVFDGNHHTITLSGDAVRGLFEVNTGIIKNLNIIISSQFEINERDVRTGSISSDNKGIIQDCTVKGILLITYNYTGGTLYAGGIAAINTGEINRCWSALDISIDGLPYDVGVRTGELIVGGIAGKSYGSISQCLNSGDISTRFSENIELLSGGAYFWYLVGGIAGCVDEYCSTVTSCIQAGNDIEMIGTFIGDSVISPSGIDYYLYAGVYYDVQSGFVVGGEYNHGTHASISTSKIAKDCCVCENSLLEVDLHDMDYYCGVDESYSADKSSYSVRSCEEIKKWWDSLERGYAVDIDISFEEVQVTGNIGEPVSLNATYTANNNPVDIKWECSDSKAVTFSETNIQGPTETGKENTWWISVMATGMVEGEYDITLNVDGNTATTKLVVEDTRSVCFFNKWDAENQIAYFGQNDLTGSQVTDETDTSFFENLDNLLGQYVLVESKDREDDLIAPRTLISIEPIETKVGTVTAADTESITIGEETYATPDGLMLPDSYVGEIVLYHVYEGKIKGIEILEKEEGTLTYWNAESREVRIGESYTLSSLADDETIKFLGETGSRNDTVYYYADSNNFVYQINELADFTWNKSDFEIGTDNFKFINSASDFFNEEEYKDYVIVQNTKSLLSWTDWLTTPNRELCYQISDESFNRLTLGLNNEAYTSVLQARNTLWGGSCSGMALVSAISYVDSSRLPLNQIEPSLNISNLHDLEPPNNSVNVEDVVNYYQLSQYLPFENTAMVLNTKNYLNDVQQLIEAVDNVDIPVYACICDKNGNEVHAVLLLEVENEKSEYYSVKVYDPNVRDGFTTMKIFKDPKYQTQDICSGLLDCTRISYDSSTTADEDKATFSLMPYYIYSENIEDVDFLNYFSNNTNEQIGFELPIISVSSNVNVHLTTDNSEINYQGRLSEN